MSTETRWGYGISLVLGFLGLGVMAGQNFVFNGWVAFFWGLALLSLLWTIFHKGEEKQALPHTPEPKLPQSSTLAMLERMGAKVELPPMSNNPVLDIEPEVVSEMVPNAIVGDRDTASERVCPRSALELMAIVKTKTGLQQQLAMSPYIGLRLTVSGRLANAEMVMGDLTAHIRLSKNPEQIQLAHVRFDEQLSKDRQYEQILTALNDGDSLVATGKLTGATQDSVSIKEAELISYGKP